MNMLNRIFFFESENSVTMLDNSHFKITDTIEDIIKHYKNRIFYDLERIVKIGWDFQLQIYSDVFKKMKLRELISYNTPDSVESVVIFDFADFKEEIDKHISNLLKLKNDAEASKEN